MLTQLLTMTATHKFSSQVDEGFTAGAGGVELEEGRVQPPVGHRPHVVHAEPDGEQVKPLVPHGSTKVWEDKRHV